MAIKFNGSDTIMPFALYETIQCVNLDNSWEILIFVYDSLILSLMKLTREQE